MFENEDDKAEPPVSEFENEGMYATEIADDVAVLYKNQMYCLFFSQRRYLPNKFMDGKDLRSNKRLLYEVRLVEATADTLQTCLKREIEKQLTKENDLWNAKYDSEQAEAATVFVSDVGRLPPEGQREAALEIQRAIHSSNIFEIIAKYKDENSRAEQ